MMGGGYRWVGVCGRINVLGDGGDGYAAEGE